MIERKELTLTTIDDVTNAMLNKKSLEVRQLQEYSLMKPQSGKPAPSFVVIQPDISKEVELFSLASLPI